MSTPAMIWLLLAGLGLGITIAQHGKPKTGKVSAVSHAIAVTIAFGLLYWGGFFAKVVP